MSVFHFHLISDASGETVLSMARVSLLQFDDIETKQHVSNFVRSPSDVNRALSRIEKFPGLCLYTLVNTEIQDLLEDGCRKLNVPCISIMDPVLAAIAGFVGKKIKGLPGRHQGMNSEYFNRIEALHYVLAHDDGKSTQDLSSADVIILGVSRTSKTPTCIYLANRGLKAANFPIVPGCALPEEVLNATGPLIVGLTTDPKVLGQIRRSRLRLLNQNDATDYTDLESLTKEVNEARRLFTEHGLPTVNVTRRSIEETAAAIVQLHSEYQDSQQ